MFWAVLGVNSLVAASFFMFVGAIASNLRVAQTIAPIVVVLFSLFGGFYVNIDSVPIYYVWLGSIAFQKYVFEVMAVNEFTGLTFSCDGGDPACLADGQEALEFLGMNNVVIGHNFAILVAMIVFYQALAFTALKYVPNWEKR